MTMKKSPWLTLIVTAIITFVIIAILFPVFAQSKSSAKVASELSMQKQQALEREMERADLEAPPLPEMTMAAMAPQRQVIRKGSISIRVKSVEETERQITESVVAGGGYVETTSTSDLAGDDPRVDMTIRVKSEGFDDALNTLADLGTVLSKQIDSSDVTAQIVDLDARTKTMAAKEETYRNMLRTAVNTQDVITLQEQLTQVRTEIERMEAQRNSLSKLADLSTIEVSLTQNATMPVVAQDPNWFGQTLATTATSFVGGLRNILTAVLWIVGAAPYWLLPALLAFWAWRKHNHTATTAQ